MIQKVQPGQKFKMSAATFNTFADVANNFQSKQLNKLQQSSVGWPAQASTDIILIKNTCGQARDRFEILALGVPLFLPADAPDEFKNRVVFNGIAPTSSTKPGAFAILLEPLAINAIGRAQASGVCPAYVNFASNTDTYANVAAGAYNLASGTSGAAEILWKETGTGLKWAVVRLGNSTAPAGTAVFVARVVSNYSGGFYYIREQQVDGNGSMSDKTGASNVMATNLAEATTGPGNAVDANQLVMVMPYYTGSQTHPVFYYFDHPCYAKYLS
jgi:hypothetical protein